MEFWTGVRPTEIVLNKDKKMNVLAKRGATRGLPSGLPILVLVSPKHAYIKSHAEKPNVSYLMRQKGYILDEFQSQYFNLLF